MAPRPPSPVQDLAAAAPDGVVTFDLRDRASIAVEVAAPGGEARTLDLLLLARSDSMLVLNRDIAHALDLPAVLFGLGSATVRDGDLSVSGEVRQARYRIAPGGWEAVWALDMDRDMHAGHDGAITFAAVPASRFRVLLNDPPADGAREIWVDMELDPRTATAEEERDYDRLEFGYDFAFHQDVVTANAKAVTYLDRNRRLRPVSGPAPFTRLFGRTAPHVRFEVTPPLRLAGLPVDRLLGEVEADFDPDAQPPADGVDRIEVFHDRRRPGFAPTIGLGRAFFSPCSQLRVERFEDGGMELSLLCRADAVSPSDDASG